MTALEPAAAEAALDEILRARLLRPARRAGASSSRTRSCATSVYAELNVLRRARLHRRAAEALRALGESRHLEEIAFHLFQAASTGDAREAAELLMRAGRRAVDGLAYEDAAEHFQRALEALELAGAEAEAGPVLLARGDALLRAGEPAQRRASSSRPPRGSRAATDDPVLLAEAALGYAGLGITIVDLDAETIARLEEALAALGSGSPRPALTAAGAPGGRALLRARPPPLGDAQRRGRRRRGRRSERAGRGAQRPPRRAVAPGPHRGAPARPRRR